MINLNHLAGDLEQLYAKLIMMRRACYAPNQRIVVQYTEQDRFFHDSPVGFAIHNFLTLLYEADISLSQITFVTTHNRLADSIRPFVCHEKDFPEIHIVLVYRNIYGSIKNIVADPRLPQKNLKHLGLCMLGNVREHRIRLYQYLKHHDLLDKIKTSFNNKKNPLLSPSPQDDKVPAQDSDLSHLGLVYSVPARANESWCKPITNEEIRSLVDVVLDLGVSDPCIPAAGHRFYDDFALDVVTESNFHYPSQFITEKTLRPLLLKTAFLIFGPQKFLAYLRSWGFETFGDLWDESYDDISDPQDRFVKCCHVLKDLSDMTLSDWNAVYQKIDSRLDHNRELLLQYIEKEFVPLHKRYQL